MKRKIALATLVLIPISLTAIAHPGRTDSNGGHNDRKNGGYHYHNSGRSTSSSSSSSSTSSGSTYQLPSNQYGSSSTPSEPVIKKVRSFTECTKELTTMSLRFDKLEEKLLEQQKEIIRMKAALKKNGIEIPE